MTPQEQMALYQRNRIMTASPAELTLMLYDGAIKFCNLAIMAIEKKDIPAVHTNIVKVEKIIAEFRTTLDFKYEVAKDFDRIYVYLLQRLSQANIKKDAAILEEVLVHLREMRDNWKQVMHKSRAV